MCLAVLHVASYLVVGVAGLLVLCGDVPAVVALLTDLLLDVLHALFGVA